MKLFCIRLGFLHAVASAAKGLAGGIVLMWREGTNIEFVWKNDKVICCDVKGLVEDRSWRLFG